MEQDQKTVGNTLGNINIWGWGLIKMFLKEVEKEYSESKRRMRSFYFNIKKFEEEVRFKKRAVNYVKCCSNLKPVKGGTVSTGFSHNMSLETL